MDFTGPWRERLAALPGGGHLAGCDEVGRGPLAGPVVGACAFLSFDEGFFPYGAGSVTRRLRSLGVKDSKLLTANKRLRILEKLNLAYDFMGPGEVIELLCGKNWSLKISLVEISPEKIDELNILHASELAMKEAYLACWSGKQGTLLVDGHRKLTGLAPNVECEALIKGDEGSLLIGLASIVAKEYRDHLMREFDQVYPGYGFAAHAGYPTQAHMRALSKIGPCPIHRKSYGPVAKLLGKECESEQEGQREVSTEGT